MKKLILAILSCGLATSLMYGQVSEQTPMTRADSLAGFNEDSVRAVAVAHGIEPWEVEVHVQACQYRYLRDKYGLNNNANRIHTPLVPMTPCTNMGFETGDFSGWSGFIGDNTASSLGPLQNIQPGIFSGALNPAESDNTARHSVMNSSAPNDACGNFPVCPAGYGTYVCRLGNTYANYQGEGITQTFVVDPQNTQFSYRYAVVLDDGGQHPPAEQPYFKISVYDSLGQPVNACAQYYVAADGNNVGFSQCQFGIYYRPWTTVSFDLSAFVNQSITIEFLAAGCIWSGHFAMAYIDASCSSIADAVSATFCPGSPGAFLVAPPGFGDYQWFYPNGSPIIGATNDSLFVPSATQGDTFSVEMHAIADTSCVTILNVVVELTLLQTSITGTDPICYGQSNGTATETCANCVPPVTYSWNSTPPQGTQTATNLPAGTYIVSLTDSIGCTEQDTVTLVNPPQLDTTGITYGFCYGDDEIVLIGLPGMPGYQWLDSTKTPIPGETNPTYTVTNPYVSQLIYCIYNTSPCPQTDSIYLDFVPYNDFEPDTLVNVFTPNGDMKNDYFYPFYDHLIAGQSGVNQQPQYDFDDLYVYTYEVWIYNRWGQEVFYSSDYNYGWDGQYDDKDADAGVYYYICKYTNRCHLEMVPITKTGFVHLVR